jgi:hypothetical protein
VTLEIIRRVQPVADGADIEPRRVGDVAVCVPVSPVKSVRNTWNTACGLAKALGPVPRLRSALVTGPRKYGPAFDVPIDGPGRAFIHGPQQTAGAAERAVQRRAADDGLEEPDGRRWRAGDPCRTEVRGSSWLIWCVEANSETPRSWDRFGPGKLVGETVDRT